MSSLKSIENERAKFAYKCVEDAKKAYKDKAQIDEEFYYTDKYDSYISKVPMMIKVNGLGNTLAFILSKSKGSKAGKKTDEPKNAYDLIYLQITKWFAEYRSYLLNIKETDDLVKKVIELPSKEYKAVTFEVLSLLNWLKRFADGLIEGEDK
ncbi:MAG TPA: type III-B CRISPR module-associated protein Cmr5 [bacterium]|nr:type III-B CRISPR module-associated protein Cmr5 [bacterium]